MRSILLALALLVLPSVATAENVIVTTTITTAQSAAETMARTGVMRHCGRAGGRREGIGMGPTPDAAYRACCFFGRYRIVERGVAYSPLRRSWFAVIRYAD
jgi:hypothetical protein